MAKEIVTVCPYCGAGCLMSLTVEQDRITRVAPFAKGDRFLCPKAAKVSDFVHNPQRLTAPLIREAGGFRTASWDEALGVVSERLQAIRDAHGPDSLGFMGSGCFTNEEIYVFQKFVRAVIGTNNIDSCARICHIPSLKALMKSIGSATMSNPMDDISGTKVIFIAGYNPEACHPRLYHKKIKAAKAGGSRLIVMDPRSTSAARMADVFLRLRPGTDIPVLNAMANVMIAEDLVDAAFINARTEGFAALKERVKTYSPEAVERLSGVSAELIAKAARMYAGSGGSSVILWGMGMTQHISGVDNISALINLILLTGNIGRPNAGLSPVRGQNNVQGASFIGALPDIFPGYKSVADHAARERFQSLWGVPSLPEKAGRTSTVFIPDVLGGKTRALYIAAENPAVSQPNLQVTRSALADAEFLVVQDIFMTETAKMADVVLPACTFAEKSGTYIRLDRAVQLLNPALSPRGESLPDWKIICMLADRMGHGKLFPYQAEADIWQELRQAVPDLAGITYDRLRDGAGVHMPCTDPSHPGTAVRYADSFPRPGGKALFVPVDFTPPAEGPDDEFGFTLITGRDANHYNTATITRHVPYLRERTEDAYVELHPQDADRLGVRDGEYVEMTSRRGSLCLKTRLTESVIPGVVFAPFHFCQTPINLLTNDALDPTAKTPEYKVCAVKIAKVAVGGSRKESAECAAQ